MNKKESVVSKMPEEITEKLIQGINDLQKKKVNEVSARLQEAGIDAPQSYRDDMNGFARGLSMMGDYVIQFLKEKSGRN